MCLKTFAHIIPCKRASNCIVKCSQKIVVMKVMHTYLRLCVGEFPADMTSQPDRFVYFLRATNGMVPLPNSSAEAAEILPRHFEASVVSGNSLDMLEQLLDMVEHSLLFNCT